MQLEPLIFKGLMVRDEYIRKVLPYLNKEYFPDKSSQAVFLIIQKYFLKYNSLPTQAVLEVEIDKLRDLNETLFKSTHELLTIIDNTNISTVDSQWLVDSTEAYVKERALHNALMKSIEIYNGKEAKLTSSAIPDLMKDALAISFDNNLGHDYDENIEEQYEFYTNPVNKISFGIDTLNRATNGGITRKTLSLGLAGTHVGKTLIHCSLAADFYQQGLNVVFFTLEEDELKIRQRIDANMLKVDIKDLPNTVKISGKDKYRGRVKSISKKTTGNLIIKEYPANSASAATFRYFLNELKVKRGIIADIVIIDYLGLVKSDRISKADQSYGYQKSVSEEIRGLMQEINAAGFSAMQLNRGGLKSSDPDMTDVADSMGVLFTADFAYIVIATEELIAQGKYMFKQEKNRFHDLNYMKKFTLGVDRQRMKIYDIDDPRVPDLADRPVFDATEYGSDSNKMFSEFV